MSERWIFTTTPPTFDAQLQYGTGEYEFAHLRLPRRAGPHPVIIYLHGGFWRAAISLSYAEHVCATLTSLGYATYCVEYLRTGQTGGGWPGTFESVAGATDYLREIAGRYQLDLARTVAMGHSAGGQMALWLVGRPNTISAWAAQPISLRGAISLAGVTDLRRSYYMGLGEGAAEAFMDGSPDEMPRAYSAASPVENLPVGLPQLLVHGDQDARVPFSFSQDYTTHARELGDTVTLLKLPGAGHFDLVDPKSSYWPIIQQYVVSFMQQFS